jgi:SAM-dependent methyltransferase
VAALAPKLAGLRRRARAAFDRLLFRHPFEGKSAEIYRTRERPAFCDFDDRLITRLADQLAGAERLLEVGAGPATFSLAAKRRHPSLQVVALEPSRALAKMAHAAARGSDISVVRGVAEALPLADASISVAVCLSSIRHVADRRRTFAELRRVLVPGGALIIAELDPDATAARVAYHADRLDGRLLRAAFGPLVVRTAPPWQTIAASAASAGFGLVRHSVDPQQPLYLLEFR